MSDSNWQFFELGSVSRKKTVQKYFSGWFWIETTISSEDIISKDEK